MNETDDELRRRVAAAYDPVLHEPVPDRLTALLARPAQVVDLQAQRERRAARRFPALSWMQLGGMAASVVAGVLLGTQLRSPPGETLLAETRGALVAGAGLARALDTRLAGDAPSAIDVRLSFVDKAGRFCRTFSAGAVAGLACREGDAWSVVATAQAEPAPAGGMRPAASPLPRPVLEAVDARIAGTALDAAQERQARDRGWVR